MHDSQKHLASHLFSYLGMFLGSFIAAFAIDIFFVPNSLIDGGIVGLAMIAAKFFQSSSYLPLFLLIFNLPFLIMAYRFIGKAFVIQLAIAILSFAFFLATIPYIFPYPFDGDILEVVVIGGAFLGVGIGLIIRFGGCLDGTEILGIIINKKKGFTVGQTVFLCNILVFSTAGFVFQDWHPAILSLITYIVVVKIMDTVIVGLDETKAVFVISKRPEEISNAIMHELGIGLTILYGRGGFSKTPTDILYIIIERLQLADLKEIIYQIDPEAFITISNLHEVAYGQHGVKRTKRIVSPHIRTVVKKMIGSPTA